MISVCTIELQKGHITDGSCTETQVWEHSPLVIDKNDYCHLDFELNLRSDHSSDGQIAHPKSLHHPVTYLGLSHDGKLLNPHYIKSVHE